jgi:hypothetical protein
VIATAFCKWRIPVPADAKELHELELEVYTNKRRFRMTREALVRRSGACAL